jgi:DNA polymerase-3 subunit alpha
MDTVIAGRDIYLGFVLVKDLEKKVVHALVEERTRHGMYHGVEDLINRLSVSLEQATLLIRAGAFRFTGKNKKELLWAAHFLLGNTGKSRPEKLLFPPEQRAFNLPELTLEAHEDAFDEMELMGFPLENPFQLLREPVKSQQVARQLPEHLGESILICGYVVTVKNTRTSNGKGMYFGTFLDIEGDFIDTVHFPPVAARYPFRGRGIYTLKGKVMEEFGYYTLEVEEMIKETYIDDPRYMDSQIVKKSNSQEVE